MGNDICSEAANYCDHRDSPLTTIYEYPAIREPKAKEKELLLPELEAEVREVLQEKSNCDVMQANTCWSSSRRRCW